MKYCGILVVGVSNLIILSTGLSLNESIPQITVPGRRGKKAPKTIGYIPPDVLNKIPALRGQLWKDAAEYGDAPPDLLGALRDGDCQLVLEVRSGGKTCVTKIDPAPMRSSVAALLDSFKRQGAKIKVFQMDPKTEVYKQVFETPKHRTEQNSELTDLVSHFEDPQGELSKALQLAVLQSEGNVEHFRPELTDDVVRGRRKYFRAPTWPLPIAQKRSRVTAMGLSFPGVNLAPFRSMSLSEYEDRPFFVESSLLWDPGCSFLPARLTSRNFIELQVEEKSEQIRIVGDQENEAPSILQSLINWLPELGDAFSLEGVAFRRVAEGEYKLAFYFDVSRVLGRSRTLQVEETEISYQPNHY